MVPLANHDQHFVPLDNSHQSEKISSLTHQSSTGKRNQHKHQPVAKEQSHTTAAGHPLSSNKKARSCSMLPTPTSKGTIAQGCSNRIMKSSSSHSKFPVTPSQDHYLQNSLHSTRKALDSTLSYPKSRTKSSSKFNKTSSLESNKTTLNSRLLLPKTQSTSSSLDFCWKSPLSPSAQSVSTSSLSALQHEETPLLNVIWTSPLLLSSQSTPSSTRLHSKSQKESSLDDLWTSSMECNEESLSPPSLNNKLQEINFLPTSSSLEPNPTAQSSLFPESRPQKVPISNSNNNVLSLPLSKLKSRKSPLLLQPVQPSQSLPLDLPKSQTMPRRDRNFQIPNSPVCKSKGQNTMSQNDKHRAPQLPTFHAKPSISGQRLSSAKPDIKNRAASVMGSRLQTKGSFELSGKSESDNETPWSLDYSHPCIIRGGTVPVDVVNKIVNSISKSTIQKDLSRQILFRRMRGKPNPHPGPRLSSMYSVCLDCASCIKSQCSHLTGKKDPRCASLFVIPTPETNSDGKIDVKIVLILSLPETSESQFLLPVKDNQPGVIDDNIEELEKIAQFFPASESDIIQELAAKNKCLAENKALSQEPQAIDWLLYVKNSSRLQSQSQLLAPSTSSSCSSFSSSSSSSSSSSDLPSPSPPLKEVSPPPLPDKVSAKIRSYHRLPPGVSWLEFISGKSPENPKLRHSPSVKNKRVRTRTTKKGKRGTSTLFRYLQTKFHTEKL